MRARLIGLAVIACVGGLTAAGGTDAARPPIVVDDLRDNCPDAEFTSIQAGVDAAIARGTKTVVVCRGAYAETVTIPPAGTGLKLRGPGDAADANTNCTPDRLPDPAKDAIVTGTGAYGIGVEAAGASVQGLAVSGIETGPGIRTSATASGYALRYNLIIDNMRGLELRTSGSVRLTAEFNCIIDNNRNTAGSDPGNPSGYAIWSPKLSNSVIQGNVLRAHAEKAIDISQVKALVIKNNSLFADGSIEFHRGTSAFVQSNRVSQANAKTAILLEGVSDFLVKSNKITEGLGGGIAVLPKGGGAFTANSVQYNTVKRVAGHGIQIVAPGASRNNELIHNRVFDVGREGLFVQSEAVEGATGVLVDDNHAERSGDHDCHEEAGPNTWNGNVGLTQNRPGLCPGAEVKPGP